MNSNISFNCNLNFVFIAGEKDRKKFCWEIIPQRIVNVNTTTTGLFRVSYTYVYKKVIPFDCAVWWIWLTYMIFWIIIALYCELMTGVIVLMIRVYSSKFRLKCKDVKSNLMVVEYQQKISTHDKRRKNMLRTVIKFYKINFFYFTHFKRVKNRFIWLNKSFEQTTSSSHFYNIASAAH